jgi:hypothetical protein
MLGLGKLLKIRDHKWDEVSERLTVELDKWENSTKKGISCEI